MSTTPAQTLRQQIVDNLVGQAEIAVRLGVQHRTVQAWRQRSRTSETVGFPPEFITVSGTPVWWWPEVAAWAANRHARRHQAAEAAPSAPPFDNGAGDRVFTEEECLEAEQAVEGALIGCADHGKKKRAVAGGAFYVCADCGVRL